MVLMQQILRVLNRKIISCSVFLFFVSGCNILSQSCSEFEQSLKNVCQIDDTTYAININQLTNIDFDTLYIFEEQWFPDEVEQIIGAKYEKVLPDDGRQFVFMKNKKIIKQFHSECSIDFSIDQYKGYLKINGKEKLYIKRRELQNNPDNPKDGSYFSYTVSLEER